MSFTKLSARSSPSSCFFSFFAAADLFCFAGVAGAAAFSARFAAFSRFCAMSSGISAVSNGFPESHSSMSARECLHGNCLLGQEQRNTGSFPEKSAEVE